MNDYLNYGEYNPDMCEYNPRSAELERELRNLVENVENPVETVKNPMVFPNCIIFARFVGQSASTNC